MKKYKIVDDSGLDYNFLHGFGEEKSWLGEIVNGADEPVNGSLTVEQPFGPGTWTASAECFEEVVDQPDTDTNLKIVHARLLANMVELRDELFKASTKAKEREDYDRADALWDAAGQLNMRIRPYQAEVHQVEVHQAEVHAMFKAIDTVSPNESYDAVKSLIDSLAARLGDGHEDIKRARDLVEFMETPVVD